MNQITGVCFLFHSLLNAKPLLKEVHVHLFIPPHLIWWEEQPPAAVCAIHSQIKRGFPDINPCLQYLFYNLYLRNSLKSADQLFRPRKYLFPWSFQKFQLKFDNWPDNVKLILFCVVKIILWIKVRKPWHSTKSCAGIIFQSCTVMKHETRLPYLKSLKGFLTPEYFHYILTH